MAYSELTVFINQLLDQKGLGSLDSEVREQLVSDLEKRLVDQINRALVEALPEDKLAEFTKLADSNSSDEQLQTFLSENGVDSQQVTTDVMLQFKQAYLG